MGLLARRPDISRLRQGTIFQKVPEAQTKTPPAGLQTGESIHCKIGRFLQQSPKQDGHWMGLSVVLDNQFGFFQGYGPNSFIHGYKGPSAGEEFKFFASPIH
jgi:hypothetical protein